MQILETSMSGHDGDGYRKHIFFFIIITKTGASCSITLKLTYSVESCGTQAKRKAGVNGFD